MNPNKSCMSSYSAKLTQGTLLHLSVCSSAGGHWGCSHRLAAVNSVPMSSWYPDFTFPFALLGFIFLKSSWKTGTALIFLFFRWRHRNSVSLLLFGRRQVWINSPLISAASVNHGRARVPQCLPSGWGRKRDIAWESLLFTSGCRKGYLCSQSILKGQGKHFSFTYLRSSYSRTKGVSQWTSDSSCKC